MTTDPPASKIQPTPAATWDPAVAGADLANKVSSRNRHINMLLGAGASRPAGLPDVVHLLKLVLSDLDDELKPIATSVFETRNLEVGLSRIRRIKALLSESENFGDFNLDTATRLDVEISKSIVHHLKAKPVDMTAYMDLASWVAGDYYMQPIEIFTLNYDLLVETGFESHGVSYADGFVGNLRARFRADIVDGTGSSMDTYPSNFARLWKMHGSLNWLVDEEGRIVRTGALAPDDHVAAIYPSDEKYDESRRVPFTVLQDRFRRALAVPESLTLISGYSFGDQHINEAIFDAARRYPRSEIVAFCFGEVAAEAVAPALPNVTILGATEAIIGADRRPWLPPEGVSELLWKDDNFRLGDFSALTAFLSRSTRVEQWQDAGLIDPRVVNSNG